MPSFCPKLESFIKVMHRRKAKNDQKFTKFCFSRDLSLKSGKINFHEFWTIFGHSTVHHLKKTPKITPKLNLQKKTVSTENCSASTSSLLGKFVPVGSWLTQITMFASKCHLPNFKSAACLHMSFIGQFDIIPNFRFIFKKHYFVSNS